MVSPLVLGSDVPGLGAVLTTPVLELIGELHRAMDGTRSNLLLARRSRRDRVAAGAPLALGMPGEPWTGTGAAPAGTLLDLEDGRVPTWDAVIGCTLGDPPGVIRPRGLHRIEKHLQSQGVGVSAAIVDVALCLSAWPDRPPAVSVPKLESGAEARWWRQLLTHAAALLGIGTPSVRVLLETLPGLLDAEQILCELKDLAVAVDFDELDHRVSMIREFAETVPQRPQSGDVPGSGGYLDAARRRTAQVAARHGLGASVDTTPVTAAELLDIPSPADPITELAVRSHLRTLLDHVVHALGGCGSGNGAAAELSRSLLWQWQVDRVMLDSRRILTPLAIAELADTHLEQLADVWADLPGGRNLLADARNLVVDLVGRHTYADHLSVELDALLP